jgi:lambda repressor-like predicted transcriptional regulator
MACDKSAKQILALLDTQGIKSFREIDRVYGLKAGISSSAARFPVKAGEEAIAQALGLKAKDIWPSRYDSTTGARITPQPAQNYPSSQNHAA